MFRWRCLKCGEMVWNCNTCTCGNTREQNTKLYEEREFQKKIDRLRKQGVPYVCSICGKPAPDEKNTSERYSCWTSPYCPECGAKMDRERKKNDKE